MKRVFLDTNVVVDLLAERLPYYHSAARLFDLAEHKKIELFISALTIANTNYVLTRAGGNEVARAAIHNLLPFVTILPLDEVIVKRALATFDFDDTEDAMQYHTALSNNIPVLISRDRTGFVSASITVAHPDEYIAGFSHEP